MTVSDGNDTRVPLADDSASPKQRAEGFLRAVQETAPVGQENVEGALISIGWALLEVAEQVAALRDSRTTWLTDTGGPMTHPGGSVTKRRRPWRLQVQARSTDQWIEWGQYGSHEKAFAMQLAYVKDGYTSDESPWQAMRVVHVDDPILGKRR